jgi:hypothetical protein
VGRTTDAGDRTPLTHRDSTVSPTVGGGEHGSRARCAVCGRLSYACRRTARSGAKPGTGATTLRGAPQPQRRLRLRPALRDGDCRDGGDAACSAAACGRRLAQSRARRGAATLRGNGESSASELRLDTVDCYVADPCIQRAAPRALRVSPTRDPVVACEAAADCALAVGDLLRRRCICRSMPGRLSTGASAGYDLDGIIMRQSLPRRRQWRTASATCASGTDGRTGLKRPPSSGGNVG